MPTIQKLTLEITTPSQQKGEEILVNIRHFLETEILTMLEQYLEQWGQEAYIQRIEQLTLDLGTLSLADFPRNVLSIFKEKLKEELELAILKSRKIETASLKGMLKQKSEQQFFNPEDQKQYSAKKQLNTTTITPTQRLEEILLYFLQNGVLPWWSGKIRSLANLEKAIIQVLKKEKASHLFAEIRSILSSKMKGLERFVFQFSDVLHILVVETFFPAQKTSILRLRQVLQKHLLPILLQWNITTTEFQKMLWLVTFNEQKSHAQARNKNLIIKSVLNELSKKITGNEYHQLLNQVEENFTNLKMESTEEETINQVIEVIKEISPNSTNTESTLSISTTEKEPLNQTQKNLEKKTIAKEKNSTVVESNEDFSEEIYLPQAGLPLIHAMLPPFLQRLGLVKHNNFISKKGRKQAIYLLHYLVAEEENPSEEKLFLYKLLCGFPLDEVLPPPHPFTEETKQECENMLQAAISYWKIMPNTTPRSLRGSFLQRSGKLSKTDNGWLLQLESAPYDIILDYAPWTLSMVRFAWMENFLTVEWGR